MSKIVYIILYLMCSTSGLTLIKLGTDGTKISLSSNLLNIDITWKLLLGFFVYILSFLIWTMVISKYDLSFIYPIVTAVLFVLVMVSSSVFLKETISTTQIVGVIIIIVGVVVTTLKK